MDIPSSNSINLGQNNYTFPSSTSATTIPSSQTLFYSNLVSQQSISSQYEINTTVPSEKGMISYQKESLNLPPEDSSIVSEGENDLSNIIDEKSQLINVSEETIQTYEEFYQNMSQEELLEKYSKLQKSNFLKNILRSFYSFIFEDGDEIVIESVVQEASKSISQIRKEFTAFTKHKKHNQSTLVSIMKSKRFSSILYYYLSYYSLDWVRKGSTRNIEMHILCITHLKRCISSTPLIQQFKLYKKH